MSEQRSTISREELYEQLWKVPISRLTVGLGYSYVELVKLCSELNIPRPSGGYWYRLQHGGTSEQVPLPPAPEGAQMEIPFGPRLNAALPPEPPTYVGEPEAAVAAAPKKPKKIAIEKGAETTESQTTAPSAAATSSPESAVEPVKPAAPTRVAPTFSDVVEMTREELYQHVWTTPIHLLSEALGLSDVGLAKTCVQMEVPKPGRGYWARLDAGEPVEQIQLPPASIEAVTKWTFNVAANRQRRADWAASNLSAQSKGKSVPAIALPAEIEPLHEIAERHRVALEKAKPDEQGFVHLNTQTLFRCDVSVAIAPKLVRSIHAVVTELEKRGLRLVRGDKEFTQLSVVQGDDRLTVQWREAIDEIEREPTAEDKRKPSWTWQLKERRATGQLTVEVCAVGLRGQRGWTESESKPIEEVLARVMEKIAAAFEGFEAQRQREKARAAQWEEQRKQREIEWAKERERQAQLEKQREEEAKRKKHERKLAEIAEERRDNLFTAAEQWIESEQALAFIAVCERRWRDANGDSLSDDQIAWLAWARARAQERAPWTAGYPDVKKDGALDAKSIPIGGPYPETELLEAKEVESEPAEPPPTMATYVPAPEQFPYWLLHRKR
jgi:hypothetical protein